MAFIASNDAFGRARSPIHDNDDNDDNSDNSDINYDIDYLEYN